MQNSLQKWPRYILFTAILLVIDFVSKQRVLDTMYPGQTIPVFGNTFSWHLTFNKGALFGFKPSEFIPGFSDHFFFIIFTIIALGLLFYFIRTLEYHAQKFLFWGVTFVTAGALGNMVDRIFRANQAVVDFIMVDFGFRLGPIPFDPWPIFNCADMWINIGVVLILIDGFTEARKQKSVDTHE